MLDVFVSVTATVASSIRLYGGNGMLSNSQIHYKLLSKLDPNSPSLTFVRMQLTTQPPDTTTLAQLRDLIKPELDRVVDPLRSLGRSNVLSNSRSSSYLSFVEPNSSSISNLSSSVEAFNSCQPTVFDPQVMVSQAVDEAILSVRSSLTSQDYGARRNSSFSSSTSEQPRPKNVCTSYLYGTCERTTDCRFDHPASLEGSLGSRAEGRLPKAAVNLAAGRPLASRPSSFSRPQSPRKGPYKSTPKGAFRKPPGSPAATRKIRFDKAFVTMYEEDEEQIQEEEDEQQDDEQE